MCHHTLCTTDFAVDTPKTHARNIYKERVMFDLRLAARKTRTPAFDDRARFQNKPPSVERAKNTLFSHLLNTK